MNQRNHVSSLVENLFWLLPLVLILIVFNYIYAILLILTIGYIIYLILDPLVCRLERIIRIRFFSVLIVFSIFIAPIYYGISSLVNLISNEYDNIYELVIDENDEITFQKLTDLVKPKIIAKNNYPMLIQTNHLIHDTNQLEFQKNQYIKNWVDYLGIQAEIWIDHNWTGSFDQEESISRKNKFFNRKKRSCGRPLSNVVEIRAGGLESKHGAVVPCPNVLGRDSTAVMGHIQDSSLMEILNGSKMNSLREEHINETFNTEYCKNCDQLLDIPESLVWTNIKDRKYGESRISGMKLVQEYGRSTEIELKQL